MSDWIWEEKNQTDQVENLNIKRRGTDHRIHNAFSI